MLLSDFYLFLQTLFFVVQLAQPIFQHLGLNLLLLHLKFLLEFAGAVLASRLVEV